MDIQKIRKEFPILSQKVNGKPLVYLDNAATTQKPKAVIDAISNYYESYNANVHRGIHVLAERATNEYEKSREKIAKFINARRSEEIIFTKGTTESINLVAYSWARANVSKGDEILLTEMEHHSNLVPWQILAQERGAVLEFIPVDSASGKLDLSSLDKLLNSKVKLISITHTSNVLGTINPVREIIKRAHTINPKPYTLIDAAQSVPNMKVDVQSLDCDFLVFSAHKMCGPTGVGVLYAKYKILEKMPPFHGGGEMISEVYLQTSKYKDPPYKFEAGTPNIAGVIGFGAAIDYLNLLGMDNIREYEEELVRYGIERLKKVEGLTLYGPKDSSRRGGILTFTLKGIHAHDIATILDSEGIAIRSGHHCAMPLHLGLGIPASARASFYFYNTKEEVDKLVGALNKAKEIFAL